MPAIVVLLVAFALVVVLLGLSVDDHARGTAKGTADAVADIVTALLCSAESGLVVWWLLAQRRRHTRLVQTFASTTEQPELVSARLTSVIGAIADR